MGGHGASLGMRFCGSTLATFRSVGANRRGFIRRPGKMVTLRQASSGKEDEM
jgi:hypothetical protein